MKIGYYIGTLLYQHDCVVIPGFGGFIANYTSAYIHPVQNTFSPPSRQVMFNANLLHNDGLLANHVARENAISYDSALMRIAEEVVLLRTALNSGKTVELDNLGSLSTNKEHSVVFTPKVNMNWLEDAYGLPTFVSAAIRRNGYQFNQDSDNKHNSLRLPIAVRRIAAIAVPLIAIGMWSLFNTDRINSIASNYSSILPAELFSSFSISSIKKNIPLYVLSHTKTVVKKSTNQIDNTKGSLTDVRTLDIINKTNIIDPAQVTATPASPSVSNDKMLTVSSHYLIISGAFKIKENADRLLEQLKAKNFEASLAGQNKRGLYLVSAASCNDASEATLKLKEVLNKGVEAAWILKK